MGTVAAALLVVAGPAAPAGAHARVTGSSPAAGDVLATPPAEVSLHLDAKPATAEGDPLVLVDPGGRRVATGPAEVGADGRVLTVAVEPGEPLPAGDYQVVYRVVSQDSHVVLGRLTFTALRAAGPSEAAAAATGVHRLGAAWGTTARPVIGGAPAARGLAPGGPDEPRPRLVAAAVAAVALVALAGRRLARRRSPTGPARAPSLPGAARRTPDRRPGRAATVPARRPPVPATASRGGAATAGPTGRGPRRAREPRPAGASGRSRPLPGAAAAPHARRATALPTGHRPSAATVGGPRGDRRGERPAGPAGRRQRARR